LNTVRGIVLHLSDASTSLLKLLKFPTHLSLFPLEGVVSVHGARQVLDELDLALGEKSVVKVLHDLLIRLGLDEVVQMHRVRGRLSFTFLQKFAYQRQQNLC
jgi:hypothetical protein